MHGLFFGVPVTARNVCCHWHERFVLPLISSAKAIAFSIHRVDERGFAFGFDFAAEQADLGGEGVAAGLFLRLPEVF